MNDLLFVLLIIWATGATAVATWAWSLWRDAQERAQMSDMQKLTEKWGLQRYEISRRISKEEQRSVLGDATKANLNEMKQELMRTLVDDGAIVVQSENMPSKPYIELRMQALGATDYFDHPEMEGVDDVAARNEAGQSAFT